MSIFRCIVRSSALLALLPVCSLMPLLGVNAKKVKEQEFADAVIECNLKKVRSLLKDGISPNTREADGDRWPLLAWASAGFCRQTTSNAKGEFKSAGTINRQVLELLQVFVDHQVDLNARGDDGWTPLMVAVGSVRFNYMPDQKARVEQQKKMVKFLIDAGADVNIRANDGTTALMLAVEIGEYDTVKMLLEAGADTKVKNMKGQTVLTVAKQKGIARIIKAIADADASR